MAVRLLATFPLMTLKGQQITDQQLFIWYPNVGGIVGSTLWTAVMTLDGIAIDITSFVNNEHIVFGGFWSWWPERQRLLAMWDGYEVSWEPKTLVWEGVNPEDYLPAANSIFPRYVKLRDRRIWFESNRIKAMHFGTTSVVNESEVFPFSGGKVNPGRGNEDVFVAGASRACFYDTVMKKIASPHYFIDTRAEETFEELVYAPEYGVMVSGHRVNTATPEIPWARVIRIWSLEVNPTVLQPVALVAGAVKAGNVATYRTRLLGAHNDPAEGELVNWFVEGVGNLLDIQTKTDVDGYATARVQYGLSDTGTSTVTASVLC